jgi:hypothetical protein
MLKPLIQNALKLLRLKLKTKSVIIQAPMESMRQSVTYYITRINLRLEGRGA